MECDDKFLKEIFIENVDSLSDKSLKAYLNKDLDSWVDKFKK